MTVEDQILKQYQKISKTVEPFFKDKNHLKLFMLNWYKNSLKRKDVSIYTL